jgi:hypothetical protein
VPRLSSIQAPEPVEFTATLGTDSVTVTFDNAKLTGRWAREVRAAAEMEDMDTNVGNLAAILLSWDVTDDAGQLIPPSKEVLMDLPAKALAALSTSVQQAAAPSDAEGNASPASLAGPLSETSEPVSPSSPNGSDTSPLPTPSASLSQT